MHLIRVPLSQIKPEYQYAWHFVLSVDHVPPLSICLRLQDEKAEGFISLPEFRIDRAIECRRKLWVSLTCRWNYPSSTFVLTHTTWTHKTLPRVHKNTNRSSPFWLTAVPSKPVIPKSRASSSPQIVLRKWTGEQLCASVTLRVCVCVLIRTTVRGWGRHVSFHEYFNWVNQVWTRQQPINTTLCMNKAWTWAHCC